MVPVLRPSSAPWRRRAILVLGLFLLGGMGCEAAVITTTARDLPPYSGEHPRLFDDSLSLRLVNPEVPDGERLLQVRAAEADTIVLGRLQTINERSRGDHSTFELTFAVEKVLAGAPREEAVLFEVKRDNPSHGMIRARRLQLMGIRGILFLKWFQQDSEQRLHVRVEADESSVQDAIIAARM